MGTQNIIRSIYRRESGSLEDGDGNKLILKYQVLNKIITGLIDQNVNPTILVTYLDQWLNLYISGNYELEYSDDGKEVACSFYVNSQQEPNEYLLHSIGHITDFFLTRSINDTLITQIEELDNLDPEHMQERNAEYLKLTSKLKNHLNLLTVISLYLSEQFSECHKYITVLDKEFLSPQLWFIVQLILINISLFSGNGAAAVDCLSELSTSNWTDNEFDSFKNLIYWTAGMYLEENSEGIRVILWDKSLSASEKFWFLYSMSISPYFGYDINKRLHYLKMAEQYINNDINNILILTEYYNELDLWREALHLIHQKEHDLSEKRELNIAKVKTLMTANKHQEALSILNKMILEKEDDISLMTLLGDCLIATDNSQEGVAWLEKVLKINPDYSEALLILGLYNFIEAKNYRLALRYLLAAEKQSELLPEVYEILGDIYEDLGLIKKSVEYYNKSLR